MTTPYYTDLQFTPPLTSRMAPSPTGSYKSTFSTFDLVGNSSVYNANLLGGGAVDLLPRFNCIAWGSSTAELGNPVAITPWHFITSDHEGTPNGSVLTFIDYDGTLYTRTVIDVILVGGGTIGNNALKFRVGMLDAALPSSIHIPKLFPPGIYSGFDLVGNLMVKFNGNNDALIAEIITQHPASLVVKEPSDSTAAQYFSAVAGGDSGSPNLLVMPDKTLVYVGHTTSTALPNDSGGPDAIQHADIILAAVQTLNASHGGTRLPTYIGTNYTSPLVEVSLTPDSVSPLVLPSNLYGGFVYGTSWSASGGGWGGLTGATNRGGGGGARSSTVRPASPNDIIPFSIGRKGIGGTNSIAAVDPTGDTDFGFDDTCVAKPGTSATATTAGTGGQAGDGFGDETMSGGDGDIGLLTQGGGGGGGADADGDGSDASGPDGGPANQGEDSGATGGLNGQNGNDGIDFQGGGSGAGTGVGLHGGDGLDGKIDVAYYILASIQATATEIGDGGSYRIPLCEVSLAVSL